VIATRLFRQNNSYSDSGYKAEVALQDASLCSSEAFTAFVHEASISVLGGTVLDAKTSSRLGIPDPDLEDLSWLLLLTFSSLSFFL
jgi:hypothetical protein